MLNIKNISKYQVESGSGKKWTRSATLINRDSNSPYKEKYKWNFLYKTLFFIPVLITPGLFKKMLAMTGKLLDPWRWVKFSRIDFTMVLCKPYNAQKQIYAESKDGVGQESGTTTLFFIFVSLHANYCLIVDFYQVGQNNNISFHICFAKF